RADWAAHSPQDRSAARRLAVWRVPMVERAAQGQHGGVDGCGEGAMSRHRATYVLLLCTTLGLGAVNSAQAASAAQSSFAPVIGAVQPKIVKIYGAGGLGLESYQSGFLISADGHVLTAASTVLDTDTVTVVLDSGRRFEAKEVGIDPTLEIAVLKIE